MTRGAQNASSTKLDLKLAADQLQQLEDALDSESIGDVVSNAKTKLLSLSMPSLSGTASQMKSMVRLKKLSKATDRSVTEIAARCDAIMRSDPGITLEDGSDAQEIKAHALYAKARLLISIIPALNLFNRKGSYRDAIDILHQSISLSPNQATYLAIGFCLGQLKDREGAATAYRDCIALDAESEYALEAARNQRDLGLR